MIMVNIADAKARLSELIETATQGEQVIICKHNRPVAELRAADLAHTGPRDLSPMFPGATFMTEAFFEPMSDDDLREWYGPDTAPARVAESSASYSAGSAKRRKRTRRS